MAMKLEFSSADDVMDFIKVLFVASEIIVKQAEDKANKNQNSIHEIVKAVKLIVPKEKFLPWAHPPKSKRGRPAKKATQQVKE